MFLEPETRVEVVEQKLTLSYSFKVWTVHNYHSHVSGQTFVVLLKSDLDDQLL